jgi:signal transduction histidine kinase
MIRQFHATDHNPITPTAMTPQDQWLFQKEWILAWVRVGFALVAIAVIQLNPARVARFPLLSYISLGSFLIYSLAVLYFTARTRADSKKIGLAATCLDLIWVSLIVFSTGGASTPFFVYYFFPVITSGSRYGIKGGLSAAIAGVALYGFIRFNFEWEDYLGIDRFVVRSIYLVVFAYIFGFLSEFENKQNQKLLALSKTAGEVAALEERRRIVHELHDGLLQSLATHILRIETCRKLFLNSPQDLDRELGSMEHDTRSSMKAIRQFLAGKETRPFPPGMLLEKVKDDLKFLRDGFGLRVIFETEPEDFNIPDEIERELYYVLREGLMNVTRHSHASRAEMLLRRNKTEIHGSLSDDGVGFDPTAATNDSGLGLHTMKDRIKGLGGEISIDTTPGKGTKISFILPLTRRSLIGA